MPSEKSVEIDLLMDAGGARNSRTLNSCPSSSSGANNSTARDCFSISDDESQAEDDCVVMLDQKINSNHQKINSGCVEVDITAQDSTTDDDMQAEVSDLGLQIQDVCSLSAPSQSKACNILELIDTAPCLASTVDTQPRPPPPPPPGTPCARKSADRSVVKFFEQEYSQGLESLGGKSPNWNRNGKSKNWQPVVPLEDVLKRPSLRLEAPQKTGNPPNNEEEDCVVIENDSKTQDIIVVDDQHHSNSRSTVKATYSAAENHNKHLSSNCHSLSSKALSSLKRPSSPLCEDGLCRKLPRTESADELLILDSPSSVSKVIQDNSFEPLDSRGLPDPGAGGDSEICVSPDFNREPIHVVPDAPDLNGDCDVVLPSSCVQTAGDHRKEGDKWSSPQMPASSSETTNDHVSGSSSKMQRGFSQLGAASLSSPSSGLTPAPSAGGGGGIGTEEQQDADSSSGIEASSSNTRCQSLVSYDLSNSEDSESSNDNLNVTSTCHDVDVNSQDCDSKIISSTSMTQGDDVAMPLESTTCSALETMSTKTFYGSSASPDDVFPKQYSAQHGQHKSKQKKSEVKHSIIEEVVHISSDEDDTPRSRCDRHKVPSGRTNCGTSHDKSATPIKSYEEPAQSCTTPSHKGTRRKSADCVPLLIKPTKIIYRSKTCIPRECLLTPAQLSVTVKKGSFSFDVGRFVLGNVKDGRIVFRIPNDVADTLDDMLSLPPEFNPGITRMNSQITICINESTSTTTLLAFLEQVRATETANDDLGTLPDNDPTKATRRPLTWVQNISRAVRKRVPKKLASWTRPRHWSKPFFMRYGESRMRVNFKGHFSAAYNPAADDAFVQMEPYGQYYDPQQQPIQVSGFSGTVIKLFTYPPPPIARGIAVTNEDLFCLNAGEYVNDVIIDFYLKYLFNEVLSAEDRARTHIFSSFFYGHLISVTGSSADKSSSLTLPEQRHEKVRTWTRHVDIFSKDFIIVPINENYHWFLAMICFPGLCPEAKPNDTGSPKKTTEEKQEKSKSPSSSDANAVTSDESNIELISGAESNSDATKSTKEVFKNPCVLIFDSLQGDIRWDVSRTLREYLQVEWAKKKSATEGSRTFDKDFMKGCRPPCPQQPNYSDCGLYLLQYVEAFFKKPLKDFRLPIRYLRNWFDGSEARAKRSQLRALIFELKDQLNPDLEYDPIADGCCNDVAVNDYEAI